MTWESEYPRPQLVRDNYVILSDWQVNGQEIRMPFPPESKASGFQGKVPTDLSYTTAFSVHKEEKKRVMLHFGAVDQVAKVFVNDQFVGSHEGGYVPFSFDITDQVSDGDNKLLVEVHDDLDRTYPYGKQSKKPHGMWYTPVSGIWQSVWLEQVYEEGIFDIQIDCDMEKAEFRLLTKSNEISICLKDAEDHSILERELALIKDGELCYFAIDFIKEQLPIHLWSPGDPYLYYLEIQAGEDRVLTYFALRQITIEKRGEKQRLYLNKQPIFLNGVLDQGYYEAGIYVPEEPKEYDRDVLRMKDMGFNILRKHIKVEPERFYYACDKYGMIVMQDMVNNGGYNFFFDTLLPTLGMWHRPDQWPWHKRRKEVWEKHSLAIVKKVRNHPSVLAYTIFNEGWGQFEADRMYDMIKRTDPSRIVDATSGWFVQNKSDLSSYHIYFRNEHLASKVRPLLLSEAGGYARPVPGHLFHESKSYGYGNVAQSEEELMDMVRTMYQDMVIDSIPDGLCGCIFTQLSDVETEINGFYTYDRQVCKVDVAEMAEIAKRVYEARRAVE